MTIRTEAPHFEENETSAERSHRRRSAWRQRLVQAERGFVGGVRSDAVFFVHFFGISTVIAAAIVLHVGAVQWIAIAVCLTLVLTAEMFNQALKSLAQPDDGPCDPAAKRALARGTAAVMVACTGSMIVMTMIFWQRIHEILEM